MSDSIRLPIWAFQPLDRLRFRKTAFGGNEAASDSPYVTDRHILFKKAACVDRELLAELEGNSAGETVEDPLIEGALTFYKTRCTHKGEIVGQIFAPEGMPSSTPMYLAAVQAKIGDRWTTTWFDAHRLMLVLALGLCDEIRLGEAVEGALFVRKGKPAALLTAVRLNNPPLEIDRTHSRRPKEYKDREEILFSVDRHRMSYSILEPHEYQ